jgi:muconate cycloisomerase
LRVVELSVSQIRIPLRRAIRHATQTRSATDNILVRCVLEDGTTGYGEGVPRDYVTGETVDSALDLLRRSDLPAQLESCQNFSQAVAMAERLRLAPVTGDDRDCQGNAARCAVELALLDAWGRHFAEPLSLVTRMLSPELYAPRPEVHYSGALTGARGWKAPVYAAILRFYGFAQVKVKVGLAGIDDVRRLRAIRWGLGRRIDLRLDANEAWSAAEVVQRIGALKTFQISSVEQPVPHAEVQALREVRRQVQVPLMLDESLCSHIDAERAVSEQTCDLFNLRLSKCGGFIPSLRLAQFARRHGLGFELGCQVGETAVLSAAGRHFGQSVAGLRYAEGSYDRHLVREALATADLTFGRGGKASALAGPGLGIEIDSQALERVTVRRVALLGSLSPQVRHRISANR